MTTDFTCPCGETWLVLGDTPEARAEALAAFEGCGCGVGA